jgi:3-hydroxy-9,10-secoandrosta-1,3,5(10)-triene-9,17-dione monooxygenase
MTSNVTTTDNSAPTDALDSEAFVAAAESLIPGLRARQEETEEIRKLPDDTVAELHALNFVGAPVMSQWGGHDLGLDVLYRATAKLAEGCASTAWIAGNCALHSFMIGYFPHEAQAAVFESGTAPFVANGLNMSRATSEKVAGGYQLSGRWDFSSGIEHADWTAVAAMSDDGPLLFLVSREQLSIDRTWDTSGLRGTGSHDTVVQNAFIPSSFTVNLLDIGAGTAPGMAIQTSPFYRLPLHSITAGAIIATLVGLGRRAVELFEERATSVVGGMSGVFGATRPGLQLDLAESSAAIDSVERLYWSTLEEIKWTAESGAEITMNDRIRWRRNYVYTSSTITRSVERLFASSGGQALQRTSPINRVFRDATTASHHYGVAPDAVYQAYAKIRFGVDPEYTWL